MLLTPGSLPSIPEAFLVFALALVQAREVPAGVRHRTLGLAFAFCNVGIFLAALVEAVAPDAATQAIPLEPPLALLALASL